MGLFDDLLEPTATAVAEPPKAKGIFDDLVPVAEKFLEPEPGAVIPTVGPQLQRPRIQSPGIDVYGPQDFSSMTYKPEKYTSRLAKQYLNKAVLNIAENARPSTGTAEAVTWMTSPEMENVFNEMDANPGFLNRIKQVPKLWLAMTKSYYGGQGQQRKAQTKEGLKELRKPVSFEVPQAETKGEKAVDIGAGLGAFVTQILVAKKLVPPGTILPDAVAWELVNRAEDGIPGQGALTRGALGGIGKIPTSSLAGKVGKVGAESALFGGITAASGGSTEDVIIAALVPPVFNTWSFARQKYQLQKSAKAMQDKANFEFDKRQADINKAYRAQTKKISADKSIDAETRQRLLGEAETTFRSAVRGNEATLAEEVRLAKARIDAAKRRIYSDDAFAPAREKWDAERQKALKLIASGKPNKVKTGRAMLDFIESTQPPEAGIEMPTTRTGEVIEAVRGTAKIPKAPAAGKAPGTEKPLSAEQLGIQPGTTGGVSVPKPSQPIGVSPVTSEIPQTQTPSKARTAPAAEETPIQPGLQGPAAKPVGVSPVSEGKVYKVGDILQTKDGPSEVIRLTSDPSKPVVQLSDGTQILYTGKETQIPTTAKPQMTEPSEITSLRGALDRYDNETLDTQDLADDIESLEEFDESPELQDAVKKYRKALQEDISMKGRSDLEGAEKEFVDTVRSLSRPAPAEAAAEKEETLLEKQERLKREKVEGKLSDFDIVNIQSRLKTLQDARERITQQIRYQKKFEGQSESEEVNKKDAENLRKNEELLQQIEDEIGQLNQVLDTGIKSKEAPTPPAEAGTPAEAAAEGEVEVSETVLGKNSYGTDIKKQGKLIAEMTFSVDENGVAKIGFIKAFGGRGSLSISDMREAYRQLQEKIPQIKKFTGDRVTKEPAPAPQPATAKEPWEMMREEWRPIDAFKPIKEIEPGIGPTFDISDNTRQFQQEMESLKGVDVFLQPDGRMVAEFDRTWTLTDARAASDEIQVRTEGADWEPHREAVLAAVREGKIVPRAVLEEYKSEKWAQEALASHELATKPVVAQKPEKVSGKPEGKEAKPTEKPPAKTTEGIEDFGEKIGGARKDYYAVLERAKTYDIASNPLSKTFPAPDYQKLIDAGADPLVVGLVRAMRDEIPVKPRQKYKLNRWIQQVEMLRQFSDDLLTGKINKDVFLEKMNEPQFKNLLGPIKGRAELYEIVGHDVSLQGVRFRKVHFSLYRGEKNVDKWMIDKYQKTTALSNMPRELAAADTREGAIAQFVARFSSLKTEQKAPASVKFSVYAYRKAPETYWIGKKVGKNYIDLKSFGSSKEARAYLSEHYDELLKRLEKAKYIPEERRAANEKRIGPDHRKGKDVTPDMFMEAFGFRGVEFGNWVAKGGERQAALNNAYDALMDLSLILDIPSQAISLNGELGLAFGSRGRGGKRAPAAHYETGRVVINLTRKAGPGTLAHEWWHAIDNYFSRLRKQPLGFVSERPYKVRAEGEIRQEMIDAFDGIVKAYKKTGIVKRSESLDARRTKAYWSQPREISARLFENYVIESLREKGYSNDYLSNIVAQKEYMDDLSEALFKGDEAAEDVYPYLTEDEKKIVIPAYKKFFDTIETKQVPGELYASVGASKSPELDRALQRAERKVKTVYISQRKGKWLTTSQPPKYGDYYKVSAGQSSYVKGKSNFTEQAETVKAANYLAANSKAPVYVYKKGDEYIITPEQPKEAYVKVNPKGPGLTKAEMAHLGKREAEALRAGQDLGEDIGFKAGRLKGIQESRNKLKAFELAAKLTDKHRQDAADVVRQYVPKELQYRYIKRILDARTNKRIDNLTKAIHLYLDRAEQKAAKREFVKFIKDTKRKYGRGEVPFGKLRNDVRERLIKVLEQYDTSKLSEKKKEVLESRDDYIRRVSGSVADAFESLEDTGKDILQMPNARIEELNRLRKTHVGQLDTDEIRYIHSSLDHLIKIAEKKGDIKERIRAEKVGKLVNSARQEVSSRVAERGVITETQGMLSLPRRGLAVAQATPHTLVSFLTGKDNTATSEVVTGNLVKMTRDKHAIARDFVVSFREMMAEAGITKKDTDFLQETTRLKYGGKTFDIDVGSLLSIYMDTQAEGNLRSILKTGRVFHVYQRDARHLYIKMKKEVHTGRPSLSELRDIIDFVENQHPELKKMADVYFKHNWEVQAPVVNKTSMDYQNYEIARKEKYWHLSRVMPVGVEGRKTDISVSIENQGRYLPRTGGKQPLRVIPFQQEVMANIQANASYAAMTMPMQDIKALISDERWQNEVIKQGHRAELNALVTMLRRIQGMVTDQNFIDMFGAQVLNNFGKYALSVRLSGYGVQTASIPAAFEFIEPKYFIAPRSVANLPRIPIKTVKEMMDLSPTLWMRWTARQFDFVIGGAAAQNAFDNLVWGEKATTEKFLNHYTWGDQKAIYQIYLAAQEKVAAETGLERGTEEFKKRAIKITEDALETQPQWDLIYRNELTSATNIILRGSLMFSSARNAQYNVLLRAVDAYRKGRIGGGEMGKRISGVAYANILVAIVKRLVKMGVKYGWLGLIYYLADKDDDEEKKEKIRLAAEAEIRKEPGQLAIDSALNMISLPAFGQLTQNVAYETIRKIRYPNMQHDLQDVRTGNIFADLTLDVTGLVADTGKLARYAVTGERFKSGPDEGKPKWKRSAKEVADQTAELVAMRLGLPYSAPKGEIYYQAQSAEKAVARAQTDKELQEYIEKYTYKRTSISQGQIFGEPHKGHEEQVEKARVELARREKKRQQLAKR